MAENIKYGYTFYLQGKDYFVETGCSKKTKSLLAKVSQKIGVQPAPGALLWLQEHMVKAQCKDMGTYWEISGKDFGGYGSFKNDGKTVIITLD